MLVAPDTSPRNTGIEGERMTTGLVLALVLRGCYCRVLGRSHYQMYSYVVHDTCSDYEHFPCAIRATGIFGHSMGGHGALVVCVLLRNPAIATSQFQLAPTAPMRCPWGQKALTHYLGSNKENWRVWRCEELVY